MTLLVILVYLLAIGIPVYLLYRFHSQPWYWHTLAIAVALALGFVPTPPSLQGAAFDMAFGSVFLLLVVWGIGGLILVGTRRERHA